MTGQNAEFNLSDVEPTPVFRSIMDLQPAQEVPRLFGWERLVERSRDMRIEVVTDQDHLLRVRRFVVFWPKYRNDTVNAEA